MPLSRSNSRRCSISKNSRMLRKFRYRSLVQNAVGCINHYVSPPMCIFCLSFILYLLLGGYRALPRLFLHLSEMRMPSLTFETKGAHLTILYYQSLLFSGEKKLPFVALNKTGPQEITNLTMGDPAKKWILPKKILGFVNTKLHGKNQTREVFDSTKEKPTNDTRYYGNIPPWLPVCRMFYVDLGANDGMAMKVLYESGKFNNSVLNSDIIQKFGHLKSKVGENKFFSSQMCFLGFEPNPKLLPHLLKQVKKYNSFGYKAHIFSSAVWNKNENLTLYSDFTWRKRIWGASVYKSKNTGHKYSEHNVKGFKLASFIKEILKSRPIPIMKMDIEGAEYGVLLDLLDQGLLCYQYIQLILVEFHSAPLYDLNIQKGNSSIDIQTKIKGQKRCKPTMLKTLDEWSEKKKQGKKKDNSIKDISKKNSGKKDKGFKKNL